MKRWCRRTWAATCGGVVLSTLFATANSAGDELQWMQAGRPVSWQGELLARDQRYVWFRTCDQRIWKIDATSVQGWQAGTVAPLEFAAMQAALARQFPRCQIEHHSRFVLVSDLPAELRKGHMRLLERVHRQFFALWNRLGWALTAPDYPLVVVVLAEPAEFARVCSDEFGREAAIPPAFYGMHSNWVVVRGGLATGASPSYSRNVALSRSGESQVATNLVHEATHQLMMNSGMQTRLADHPRWISEGIAIYFEGGTPFAPDLWRRPGEVNPVRLPLLHAMLEQIPSGELWDALHDEDNFIDSQVGPAYYSLAWGWCHFLLHRYPGEFVHYLQLDARQARIAPPHAGPKAADRAADFANCFPCSLRQLEAEFRRYVKRFPGS